MCVFCLVQTPKASRNVGARAGKSKREPRLQSARIISNNPNDLIQVRSSRSDGATNPFHRQGGDHLFVERAYFRFGSCQSSRFSVEQKQDDHRESPVASYFALQIRPHLSYPRSTGRRSLISVSRRNFSSSSLKIVIFINKSVRTTMRLNWTFWDIMRQGWVSDVGCMYAGLWVLIM